MYLYTRTCYVTADGDERAIDTKPLQSRRLVQITTGGLWCSSYSDRGFWSSKVPLRGTLRDSGSTQSRYETAKSRQGFQIQ